MFGTGLLESLKRSVRSSPLAVVIVGLFITFILLTFVPLLSRGLDLSSLTVGTFLKINPSVLLLIGTVGALGSIASIMVRIRDAFAAYTTSSDPWPWFFFGLFKPIIGALFALFIFAIIKSGLLPLEVTGETEGWLVVAVAFIAGFSERFATDILSSTEEGLRGGKPLPFASPASTATVVDAIGDGRKQEVTKTNGAEAARNNQ